MNEQTFNQPNPSVTNAASVNSPSPAGNKVVEMLKRKWKLILIGILLLLSFIIGVFLLLRSEPSRSEEELRFTNEPTDSLKPTTPMITGSPTVPIINADRTFTPQELKAIEQQIKADQQVMQREVEIRKEFPWFYKLPLAREKYFVYFEPNEKVFVGLLYPKSGDNVEQMKAQIKQELTNVIRIPNVNSYQFDWQIIPE